MTVIDKPRLDRAHVLDLLGPHDPHPRFEDKCAELYTQQKIRGFLHLYDGEEAIAAGVIPVLGPTTGSSPPTASTAMRWCAACR
jgi:2-oxoisovalerate dehydrogenase E1 component